MEDTQVIEMLMEGGNSFAGKKRIPHPNQEKADAGQMIFTKDDETGDPVTKANAEKIDMTKVNRSELKAAFLETFEKLNDIVKKEKGIPLWNDFNVVKSGLAFNGSSTWMFRDEIGDEEFTKYKKKVGDIDITVPASRMVDLFNVLLKYEDKKIGQIEYLGNNRANPSEKQQINAVFKYETKIEEDAYEDEKGNMYDVTGKKIPDTEIVKIIK
jgi:hypothetical protein